jgi:hypothetical protein
VDGIEAPRNKYEQNSMNRNDRANTIAALRQANSSDIHDFAIILQHRFGNVESSSCPSNREGFLRTASGAPGCPYFLHNENPVVVQFPVALRSVCDLQIKKPVREGMLRKTQRKPTSTLPTRDFDFPSGSP